MLSRTWYRDVRVSLCNLCDFFLYTSSVYMALFRQREKSDFLVVVVFLHFTFTFILSIRTRQYKITQSVHYYSTAVIFAHTLQKMIFLVSVFF